MKKKGWLIGLLCAMLIGVSIGGAAYSNASADGGYEQEKVMDIMEYVQSTEYASAEGVTVAGGGEFCRIEWIDGFLNQTGGIKFNMQAQKGWGEWKPFQIYLGNTIVTLEKDTHVLVVHVWADDWATDVSGSQWVKENFDETAEHEISITRVKKTDNSGYAVRIYIDGEKLWESAVTGAMANGTFHKMYIVNGTESAITFKSTLTLPEFEEEKVADIVEYFGDASFCSADGKVVPTGALNSGNAGIIEWRMDALQNTSGIEFKFKAAGAVDDWDTMRIQFGAIDVRLNYAGGSPTFHVYNHAFGTAIGNAHATGLTNFDATVEHTLRLARVRAKAQKVGNETIRDEAVLTRIYIDGVKVIETYDRQPLAKAQTLESAYISNHANTNVTFKSLLSMPAFAAEKSMDIMDFGGDMGLFDDNGKAYAPKAWVLESRSGWIENEFAQSLCGNNGMEFMFKSDAAFDEGAENIRVMIGSTEVRLYKQAANRIAFFVYKWADVETEWGTKTGPWGAKHTVEGTFDETVWHTFKLTQVAPTNGSENGVNIRIYLDDTLVCDVFDPSYSTYAYNWVQDVCLQNMSNKTVRFKSTHAAPAFEDEVVQDLASVKDTFEQQYNESAFAGVEVGFGMRVINNVYTQEFAGNTNGFEFYFEPAVAGESWLTSGNELVYVKTENADEAVYTDDKGVMYKETFVPWSTAHAASGNVWGNDYWGFPTFFIKNNDRRVIYHHFNHDKVITDFSQIKLKYQLHVDFGTTTLGLKLLPDGQLAASVINRHIGLALFDDVIINNFDSSIKHKMKLTRAKADNNQTGGFVVNLWIDDQPMLSVYDNDALAIGGEYFQHFLMDNISGIKLKVSNVRSFDEIKAAEKEVYAVFDQADYSAANWAEIEQIIAVTDAAIDAENSIARVKELAAAAKSEIESVWTLEIEAQFADRKTEVKAAFDALVANKEYYDKQQATIDGLLAAGKAAVDGATTFEQLAAIQADYTESINAVPTKEMLKELTDARTAAKTALEGYAAAYSQADYSAENFARIEQIKNRYIALIDESEDVADIEAMPLVAKAEMDAVETKAQAELTAKKAAAEAELDAYVQEADYTAENWATVQACIADGKAAIGAAHDAAAVDAAVAAAKAEIDKVAKIEKKGCGCGSTVGSIGTGLFAMLLLGAAIVVCARKRTKETR